MIKQRVEKLRSIMKEKNIYAYIMPFFRLSSK